MDTRNEKSVLKVAKWPSLMPPALNSGFLLEITKICVETGYWWARLALQQYFPYKYFKFPKNSNCNKNSHCNVRSLKLGHFHIFDMPFAFLVFFLHHDHFLWLTRSREPVVLRAYNYCYVHLQNLFQSLLVYIDPKNAHWAVVN